MDELEFQRHRYAIEQLVLVYATQQNLTLVEVAALLAATIATYLHKEVSK